MADRFPSIEDFDEGAQTDLKDPSAEPSTDDFLAREKAILGDDADNFASANDTTNGDDDLLGGGGDSTFEKQFPDLSNNQSNATNITNSGPSVNYNSGYAATSTDEAEAEPEVITAWREKRDAANAKRAEQFAQQREETIKEAQQNIDDFYENYNSKRDKGVAQTRKEAEEFLAKREDITSGGTSWERISKIVDVSGKGTKGGASGSGKERFRELLISLKKDDKAPGSAGA